MYSPKEPCLPLTLYTDTQINWNMLILEAKGVTHLELWTTSKVLKILACEMLWRENTHVNCLESYVIQGILDLWGNSG